MHALIQVTPAEAAIVASEIEQENYKNVEIFSKTALQPFQNRTVKTILISLLYLG